MNLRRISALGAVVLLALCGLFSLAKVDTAGARDRGYYVILGSFGGRFEARERAASGCLRNSGERIGVVNSDVIDGFRPGLWVVVSGPYRSENRAQDVRDNLRHCVRDAYYKFGRIVDD